MKPEANLPMVSVIIPVFNAGACLEQCLEKLLAQNYPKEKVEIVVIDNGSTDSSPAIINRYPVKSALELKKGPAAARNAGIRLAKGEILLFIDADCLADKDLIIHHVSTHLYFQKTDRSVKAVGGGIKGSNKNFWAICDDFCSWYPNHPLLRPKVVDSYPAANISFTRELVAELGFFDEELLFAEDFAYSVKIIRKNYRIYFQPRAQVAHINRTSFTGFMQHARDWAQTQYQLRLKKLLSSSQFKSALATCLYYLLVVVYRICEVIVYGCATRRFQVFLCLPFIAVNKIYLYYYKYRGDVKYQYMLKNKRQRLAPGSTPRGKPDLKT